MTAEAGSVAHRRARVAAFHEYRMPGWVEVTPEATL